MSRISVDAGLRMWIKGGVKTASDLSDKDALIASLLERIEVLMVENTRLAARVADLEAKLGLPSKTPDNSSLPPSKGQKPSLPSVPKRKAKPHPRAVQRCVFGMIRTDL